MSLSSSKSFFHCSSEARPPRPVVAVKFHHLCGCSTVSSGGANQSLCNHALYFLAGSLAQLRRIARWASPDILAASAALIAFFVQRKPIISFIALIFCWGVALAFAKSLEVSSIRARASPKL